MLTQEQRDTFRMALASFNCLGAADVAIDDVIDDDQVVATRESLEDFFKANGRRLTREGVRPDIPFEREETAYGNLYVWREIQARKHARRGTLFVMDFGDARAAYFDGEV